MSFYWVSCRLAPCHCQKPAIDSTYLGYLGGAMTNSFDYMFRCNGQEAKAITATGTVVDVFCEETSHKLIRFLKNIISLTLLILLFINL
jgi:hypothetical protein